MLTFETADRYALNLNVVAAIEAKMPLESFSLERGRLKGDNAPLFPDARPSGKGVESIVSSNVQYRHSGLKKSLHKFALSYFKSSIEHTVTDHVFPGNPPKTWLKTSHESRSRPGTPP